MTDHIRAHYHITVGDCTADQLTSIARLVKGKPTPIDLELEAGSRRERMITVHQLGLSTSGMWSAVGKLREQGVQVVRFKLEADLAGFAPGFPAVTRKNYCEFHVRVPEGWPKECSDGWVRSRNPSKAGYVFLNSRAYNAKQMHTRLHEIDGILMACPEAEAHREWTVFDSKPQSDSDWI